MPTVIECSTPRYQDDSPLIKKALINLESICDVSDGYLLSEPVSKFGWTFFKIAIKPNLLYKIESKFSNLLSQAKGRKPSEKFLNFLTDYFESRGCKIRMKLIDF